jgi:hypothetical protein
VRARSQAAQFGMLTDIVDSRELYDSIHREVLAPKEEVYLDSGVGRQIENIHGARLTREAG